MHEATSPSPSDTGARVARTVAAILLIVAAFFGWVFHERHWRWRDCFNELGRCWDPVGEQVYVEGAGLIWGTLALLPFLGAAAPLVVGGTPLSKGKARPPLS
jgi:hypothetical protein